LRSERKIEEAKESVRDLEANSSVIKEAASREFSSPHNLNWTLGGKVGTGLEAKGMIVN
jgi:hypothetical protein